MSQSSPTLAPVSPSLELKSVLVATDFSECSEKPVRYAAALARRYGAKFYLMHVVNSVGYTMAGPESAAHAMDLALADGAESIKKLASAGKLEGVTYEIIVRAGDIWTEIQDAVAKHKIEMVVVGTHSRRGLGRLVLGSVAEQIFRHASCPVLSVGPCSSVQAERMVMDTDSPILFATDFSKPSLAALPFAASYANRRQTRLILLHMLSPVPTTEGTRWYTAEDVMEFRNAATADAKQRLSDLVSHLKLAVEPICVVQIGDVVEGIVKTAESVRALGIVLGLKPHGDAITHNPWSTAYNIVCSAECPVLTVRS